MALLYQFPQPDFGGCSGRIYEPVFERKRANLAFRVIPLLHPLQHDKKEKNREYEGHNLNKVDFYFDEALLVHISDRPTASARCEEGLFL